MISGNTLKVSGSAGAAGTSSLPSTDNPSTSDEIAFAFGAVARITRAPPSFCNSADASLAPALIALEAMSAVPAHADALPNFPGSDSHRLRR
jgi:hypothetical protein